jgi:putative transposase
MSHSYSSTLMHCVWSTKERRRLLKPELRDRLWPYIGGIARENEMKAVEIGGVEDHIHALVSLPATLPLAKAMQLLKGGSSKWIHDTFPSQREFAWQEGYGAFSVSISGLEETRAYIRNQEEHHRTRTFEQEYTAFLKRHGIEYDERYVFG